MMSDAAIGVCYYPEHWPESMSSLRWIASGGEALVFGCCGGQCPLEQR